MVRTGFPEGVGGAGGRDTKQVKREQDSRNRQTWQDVTGCGMERGVLDDTDLVNRWMTQPLTVKGNMEGRLRVY